MSLITLKFFIYIAIVAVTYYVCVAKYRWVVLFCANMGFFLSSSDGLQGKERLGLLCVFIVMTLVTWIAAIGIKKITSEKICKLITVVTIVALLFTLIAYKETAFFITNAGLLERFTGLSLGFAAPDWSAPLGISYFTLILIGYLLDVRWGHIPEPQKNPLKMLAFTGYFPHMVSGPFTRYNDVKDTLFSEIQFRFKNIWFGIQRIIWGVFKVLVISTRLSVIVENIYDVQLLPTEQNHLTGFVIIAGALLYVLNVYMNFSGSMDIVIGVSEIFGIPLAENFKRPFAATSLSEVWRRWHITLGLWLKDYVMYPTQKGLTSKFGKKSKQVFGKKAGKDIILYVSMLVVWFGVGFWHGGAWKFIFGSGLFFFVMIVGGLLLTPLFNKLIACLQINTETRSWRWFQRIRTVLLFSFSVSFGRAASLTVGLQMWKSAFTGLVDNFNNAPITIAKQMCSGLKLQDLMLIIIPLVIVFTIHHLQEKHGSIRSGLCKHKILNVILIFLLLSFTLWFGGMDGKIDFIYGNF